MGGKKKSVRRDGEIAVVYPERVNQAYTWRIEGRKREIGLTRRWDRRKEFWTRRSRINLKNSRNLISPSLNVFLFLFTLRVWHVLSESIDLWIMGSLIFMNRLSSSVLFQLRLIAWREHTAADLVHSWKPKKSVFVTEEYSVIHILNSAWWILQVCGLVCL